eukprot:s9323_g2.t1
MALRQGWRPALPIARGAQRPLLEADVSLEMANIQGVEIHYRFTFASSGGSVARPAPAAAPAPFSVRVESISRTGQSSEQPVASSTGMPIVDSDIECDLPPRPDTLGTAEEVRFVRSNRGVYHIARADLTPACGTYLREPVMSLALQACGMCLWEAGIDDSLGNQVWLRVHSRSLASVHFASDCLLLSEAVLPARWGDWSIGSCVHRTGLLPWEAVAFRFALLMLQGEPLLQWRG